MTARVDMGRQARMLERLLDEYTDGLDKRAMAGIITPRFAEEEREVAEALKATMAELTVAARVRA